MNTHPYLKTYMAGVLLPTWFLLFALAGFVTIRLLFQWPIPLEQMIVFPMAVVPNLWGLWNVLYSALVVKRAMPIGAWGALLPLLLVPGGLLLQKALGASMFTPLEAFAVLPVIAGVYYLAWKHVVAFFNDLVGAR